MKVGVLQFFSWPERRVPLETVYERALDRIEIMDKTGYDAVWLAEHHFSSFSICPSTHMMGTHIAARTSRLRIGTAVSLAVFYHPLRLAEEVAFLDVLSGGRVNWGAGRGFARVEFEAFGVLPEESYGRFRESVDVVLQAWTQDRLTYRGEYFQFDGVEVLPKPQQQPHPPVWLASTSPHAIEWAAAKGHTIMMDPHTSHTDIAAKRELYRQGLETNGFTIEGRDIPMARLLAVAETHEKAEAIARRGAQWILKSYLAPQHSPVLGKGGVGIHEPAAAQSTDPVERYLNGIIIYGTPDAVADEIARLREEMFLDYLMCAPLSHGSFTLFTEKVLPKLI